MLVAGWVELCPQRHAGARAPSAQKGTFFGDGVCAEQPHPRKPKGPPCFSPGPHASSQRLRTEGGSSRHPAPVPSAQLSSPQLFPQKEGENLSAKTPAAVATWAAGRLSSRAAHLDDSGPKGVRKQVPRCLRFRNACSTSLASEAGSIRQKDPFPGSSWERGTLMK